MPIGGTAAFGINQHPRITTPYLNSINRHGDPAPGLNVSTAQVSGSIVQPYGGFQGGKLTITNPWAKQFSDPQVGPLYGGVYMYVQFNPLMTTPATPGAICFWSDEMQYIVTADFVGGVSFKPAGVIINPTSPGNWDFIQIAGIGMAMFSAAGAIGNLVTFTPGTPPAPTLATAGGTLGVTSLGVAVMSNPAANAKSPVEISLPLGWNY